MATGINLSGLTLNPKESAEFRQFIVEQVLQSPQLNTLHSVFSGVTMKEQIVLASQFGKTGLKGDSTCTRKTSGAKSTLTQKYWMPQGIEDTLVHCNAELNGLFKAYFNKISAYKDKYDISGSDLDIFLAILFEESLSKTIWRAAWFGDLDVAAADGSTAGLVDSDNIEFYDYIDGIWKQIFVGVTASDIAKVSITENALTTKAAQTALSSGASVDYFRAVKAKSDSRLRSDPNAKLYVSREIFDNYVQYLIDKGVSYDINIMENGMQTVKWDGYDVVNMETIWGLDAREDFVDNTTNNAYYLPNRIVFTTPSNIPVGTLNESDFTELEAWYDQKERNNYMAYGFSLDSKVVEPYKIAVAY